MPRFLSFAITCDIPYPRQPSTRGDSTVSVAKTVVSPLVPPAALKYLVIFGLIKISSISLSLISVNDIELVE